MATGIVMGGSSRAYSPDTSIDIQVRAGLENLSRAYSPCTYPDIQACLILHEDFYQHGTWDMGKGSRLRAIWRVSDRHEKVQAKLITVIIVSILTYRHV